MIEIRPKKVLYKIGQTKISGSTRNESEGSYYIATLVKRVPYNYNGTKFMIYLRDLVKGADGKESRYSEAIMTNVRDDAFANAPFASFNVYWVQRFRSNEAMMRFYSEQLTGDSEKLCAF